MQLAVTVSSMAYCLKQYLAYTLPFLLTYMRNNEQTGFLRVEHIKVKLACSEVKNTETYKSQSHTYEKLDIMVDEEIDKSIVQWLVLMDKACRKYIRRKLLKRK